MLLSVIKETDKNPKPIIRVNMEVDITGDRRGSNTVRGKEVNFEVNADTKSSDQYIGFS